MARDFTFEGVNYSVIDEAARTCRTAERNSISGIVVLPELAYDNDGVPYTLIETFIGYKVEIAIILDNVKRIGI